jgi:hypothetical protein
VNAPSEQVRSVSNAFLFGSPEDNKLYTAKFLAKVKDHYRHKLKRVVLKSNYVARVVSENIFAKA